MILLLFETNKNMDEGKNLEYFLQPVEIFPLVLPQYRITLGITLVLP